MEEKDAIIMACDTPYILIRYEPIPHILPVPCGKCLSCHKDNVQMWEDRISFESLTSVRPSTFLTLTYDDKYVPENRSGNKKHVQNYLKNLRYYLDRDMTQNENKVRYFFVSEYGDDTYRIHYHACITNCDCYDQKDFNALYKAWFHPITEEPRGIITADGLLPSRIRYTVKYINNETAAMKKVYQALGLEPTFHLMSNGIGKQWMIEHQDMLRESNGYWSNGVFRPLPRYYQLQLGIGNQKNEYINRLNEIWEKYNKKLVSAGYDVIDPFDVYKIKKSGLLDQAQNFGKSKQSVLQMIIKIGRAHV